jgi:hypothetical protein
VQFEKLGIDATVARDGAGDFGLWFTETPAARAALIRHVYAGPYHAGIEDVRPIEVATALFNRVFR